MTEFQEADLEQAGASNEAAQEKLKRQIRYLLQPVRGLKIKSLP